MKTSTHEATHVSADHLGQVLRKPRCVQRQPLDGFVVTGAPVEHMPFEDVDYWDEFKTILDWASHPCVLHHSTCAGVRWAHCTTATASTRWITPRRVFGVFPQYLQDEYCFLTNGFDEIDLQPHSCLAGVNENEVRANHDLQILTWGRSPPRPDRHRVTSPKCSRSAIGSTASTRSPKNTSAIWPRA